jgi:thiamine pyrophosphokinase
MSHTVTFEEMACAWARQGAAASCAAQACALDVRAGLERHARAEALRQGARGLLFGEKNVTTAITDGAIDFDGSRRGYVSAFSFGDRCIDVTETGLKYALDRATLVNDRPLGVSNEFTGRPACISVERGTLIVVWERGHDRIK